MLPPQRSKLRNSQLRRKNAYNILVVTEVPRPVSYLLPSTPCYSNSIQNKELVNPYLLPVAPYYYLLLLKIDVIFDNIPEFKMQVQRKPDKVF